MTNVARWSLDILARTLGDPFHDTVLVDEARGRLSRDGYTRSDILHVAQSQYHDIGVAKGLGHTVAGSSGAWA